MFVTVIFASTCTQCEQRLVAEANWQLRGFILNTQMFVMLRRICGKMGHE